MDNGKNCSPQEQRIENVRLAHAYVPIQIMCSTFEPIIAIGRGTVFPELWDNYRKNEVSCHDKR